MVIKAESTADLLKNTLTVNSAEIFTKDWASKMIKNKEKLIAKQTFI